MSITRKIRALVAGAGVSLVALAAAEASAQQVTLRFHHFLPPTSYMQTSLFAPWCDKIAKESNDRLKCQIYPAMQLGGAPPQLFDQARDGVADVIWTIPTYQSGRFTKSEVFELPFMTKSDEKASRAFWTYVQKHALDEFRGVKPLALHLNDGSQFHFASKEVSKLEDFAGLKIRSPGRIGASMLTALGATPIQAPIPQVPEGIAKGVMDGGLIPWEIIPSMKLHEVARVHVETPANSPKISNSIFAMVMNEAKYNSLPADLKKVIDNNSGINLSAHVGKLFDDIVEPNRAIAKANGNKFVAIPESEMARLRQATASVVDQWKAELRGKGGDPDALLASAKALLAEFDK